MRVKLLTLMSGPQGNYFPGQIFHLPDDVAQELIDGGYAEAAPLNKVEKGRRPQAEKRPPAPSAIRRRIAAWGIDIDRFYPLEGQEVKEARGG